MLLIFFERSLTLVTYKINSAFFIPDDNFLCLNTAYTDFKRKKWDICLALS